LFAVGDIACSGRFDVIARERTFGAPKNPTFLLFLQIITTSFKFD